MSAPWSAAEDHSNQVAEHNQAMGDEAYDRDDWVDDDRPTRAESEAELFADWCWIREQARNERQS